MSPTTRSRKKENYVPHVIEAVKMLAKGKDHGVSRQNIVKYLEGKFIDQTNSGKKLPSPAAGTVKSAILAALDSGLLAHSSGVGLNGSFMLPKVSKELSAVNCDKRKAVFTKEARLRNISSLANEFHGPLDERASQQTEPSKVAISSKRQRNTKLLFPSGDLKFEEGDQFNTAEKAKALKTILKPPCKAKFASKLKRKGGSRRVKFRSPAKVIFISPCIKRRSQRKK